MIGGTKDKSMEVNKIILYSTNCPKCKVLEKKLEAKNISFEISNDVDHMLELGFMSAPVLQVGDKCMDFMDANKWVGEQ